MAWTLAVFASQQNSQVAQATHTSLPSRVLAWLPPVRLATCLAQHHFLPPAGLLEHTQPGHGQACPMCFRMGQKSTSSSPSINPFLSLYNPHLPVHKVKLAVALRISVVLSGRCPELCRTLSKLSWVSSVFMQPHRLGPAHNI